MRRTYSSSESDAKKEEMPSEQKPSKAAIEKYEHKKALASIHKAKYSERIQQDIQPGNHELICF